MVESGEALQHVDRLVRRGEFLEAYDIARTSLGDDAPRTDAQIELAYLSVLALARSGATDRAEQQLDTFGLDHASAIPDRLAEDVAALRARLAKDRALTTSDDQRAERAAVAAARYEAVHDQYGGPYPCINAATMWLVAGNVDKARTLATRALQLCEATADAESDYWTMATAAEAHLLLGDTDAADVALQAADLLSLGQWAMRASTTRQLVLICAMTGVDDCVLTPLANPTVIHYAGHRVSPDGEGRLPASELPRVASEVRDVLAKRNVGFGFGALASGADIVIAEALLERDAELHVVLPFSVDEFVAVSVADGGPHWVERFHNCLDRATSVRYASDGDYLGDPVMFDFGSGVAMGEAINRAGALESPVEQVVIWDGLPAGVSDASGTAVDVARWQRLGLPTHTIVASTRTPNADAHDDPTPHHGERVVHAMVFTDIAGFSKLGDGQMTAFMHDLMGPLGACLDSYGDKVLNRQTWGDGIYLVFDDVVVAADCALEMQQVLQGIDLAACGLGVLRGMRVGAHVGPVFRGWDPVRKELTFFGANVTRAARVEPRTPEGEVYVTHPFAALVALTRRRDLSCQYVGRLPAAKDYGVLPMYVLKRRA